MKMPISWLKDYIDIDITTYMEDLTMSGSKVEGIEFLGEELINVITGKIVEITKHPDADKLKVCQIDVALDENIQIVTGADNIFEGAIVPVAMHKSTLAGGVKITRGNLRGVKSNGMLCSYEELGIDKNLIENTPEHGILILPNDTKIGVDIRDILGLNDHVVEFEITSNRPDCLSILGLARETFATYGKKFDAPLVEVIENNEDINDFLQVEVNSNLCNRYMAKMVRDVKIAPSPMWLKQRLLACGIRPINNIVDITNYVLLEYGQPMHAFDYNKIADKKIIVKNANDNEAFETLDHEKRTLDSSMVVVCDGQKTQAVAGVMGGASSEISNDTTSVVFECANFDGASVRVTAKKLGLRTESSAKFEKGLDPENTLNAISRACELINILGCGTVVSGTIDIYPNKPEVKTLPLEAEKINKFLGTNIEKGEMIRILETLCFEVNDDIITIPSFRADVSHFADICEEIARIFGYNNMPSTSFAGQVTQGGLNAKQQFRKNVGTTLRSFGFNEIITYSFISEKAYDKINLDESLRLSTKITNPLGEDLSIMRTTTIPSMLDTIVRNINFRNKDGMFYEIGKIYLPIVENGKINADKLPLEKEIITFSSYGNTDFFEFKGYIETLFKSFNLLNVDFETETKNITYHTGRCAKILINGEVLGVFGNIHPFVLENYSVSEDILMCEIDCDILFKNINTNLIYKKLPKFPASSRDIALVCDKNLEVNKLLKCIKENAGKLLENVKLFDVFISEKLGDNKKSVAFSLTFRKDDSTITDDECDNAVKSVLDALACEYNAFLRG